MMDFGVNITNSSKRCTSSKQYPIRFLPSSIFQNLILLPHLCLNESILMNESTFSNLKPALNLLMNLPVVGLDGKMLMIHQSMKANAVGSVLALNCPGKPIAHHRHRCGCKPIFLPQIWIYIRALATSSS